MKTQMKFSQFLGLATVLALVLSATTIVRAADGGGMKGAAHLSCLTQVKSGSELEALKPGDSVAMVCTKCKTVVVERVGMQKGHIKTVTVGEKHLCAGCGSTIEVTGHGKGKTLELKHTCGKCGDDSAFCCATKPGSGPTKGMEKK